MLNRISVSALLKSIFGVMAAAIIFVLATGAWDASNRLSNAGRIVANADASAYLFTALHNLRTERAFTSTGLLGEKTGDFGPIVTGTRPVGVEALKRGIEALRQVSFAAGSTTIADMQAGFDRLLAFHKEADAAIMLPKAQRPANLAKDGFEASTALLSSIEKTSSQLSEMVKFENPYIDQLFQLRNFAWLLRTSAGDSALIVTTSYSRQPPPDVLQTYSSALGRATAALAAVDETVKRLPLPASVSEAIEKFRKEFFGELTNQHLRILKANLAGEKAEVDQATSDKLTVPKVNISVGIAEGALQAAKERAAEMRSTAQRSFYLQLLPLVVAIFISIGMMLMITRRIANPLLMVRNVMVKVAGGDFSGSLPTTERNDEIGQIIVAVNTMVDQVRDTIVNIKSSAREVTNASSEIAGATTDLSQRTEEQAASLEETSASMEEISSTVKKNAENARHASSSASATKDVADRGGQVVTEAVDAMAKIEESSRKISDIIGVIDEIARQTNLLALNAAVEAARAGEAGRGFAVVASEVRSLAQRSSQAAKDIKDLITNSNDQVKDGVDLVNRAGVALNEIVASINSVADIVADIAMASAEQATGLDEINKALTQMDGVTQQNSALVEENAATAKTLEFQAKSMDEQVSFFQVGDGTSGGEIKSFKPVSASRQISQPLHSRRVA